MSSELRNLVTASSKLQRLFIQPDQAIAAKKKSLIDLLPEQEHYLYKVLRSKPYSQFIALDGKGSWWIARLPQFSNRTAEILEAHPPTPRAKSEVILAIAMPKSNGLESVIKQATEVGVDQIVPLWSDRTISKSGAKPGTDLGNHKIERWHRIAQEAAELACSAHVPQIALPQNFADWVRNSEPCQKPQRYICHTHAQQHLYSRLNQIQVGAKIAILIGAEGGWSEAEMELAIAHNWQPISLGNQILSATTAPVVALSLVSAYLESQNPESQGLKS